MANHLEMTTCVLAVGASVRASPTRAMASKLKSLASHGTFSIEQDSHREILINNMVHRFASCRQLCRSVLRAEGRPPAQLGRQRAADACSGLAQVGGGGRAGVQRAGGSACEGGKLAR
jgi:hypothetical protein